VRFGLSAPPALDGPMTFGVLRAARAGCDVNLAVMWGNVGGEGDSTPVAVSDLDNCDEEFLGIGAPGYSAAVEGASIVARYPYSALANNRMGIGPSTTLRNLRAETRVGTWGTAGGFSSCSPEPCEPSGMSWAKSGYIGPLIDATGTANAPLKGVSSSVTRPKRQRAR
jgi:hypothetical protein